MVTRTSYTHTLTRGQQDVLTTILKTGNYRPAFVEYAHFAAKTPECSIVIYKSGKCVIQGKGAADFVMFVLEPLVLKSAQLGYEKILSPENYQPHMGIDESGKGDFFGPLVVVAAYADRELLDKMQEMGVRDSKTITSDAKALKMGSDLRRLLARRFSVVKIGPQSYNRLYSRMRNLNTMLGWAHARAIENLLTLVPSCPQAISDKFGNEKQIEQALMKKGRKITLIQRHKAESDLAVAAASVIARELFLRSLQDMEETFGMAIPKGASAAVREAAVELVKKRKPDILIEAVKCHFKTTDAVLKELGMNRGALGPDGQAESKIARPFKKRSPKLG